MTDSGMTKTKEPTLTRRDSLAFAVSVLTAAWTRKVLAGRAFTRPSFEEFLRKGAVSREAIDQFLSGHGWDKFDSELGYVQGNYFSPGGVADPWRGVDGSAVLYTHQANGARTSFVYSSNAPRINTYGDSFTHGSQVNDGETWQEYLAAALGEPIANFGVGGYGAYQAYRRMLREERTDHAAEYLIFYVWGDDNYRNLLPCRAPFVTEFAARQRIVPFFCNPYPTVELDLTTGRFLEKEALLTTPESLYRLTDPQWMVDHLKDSLALQLSAYRQGLTNDLDRAGVSRLAKWLDFYFDWSARVDLSPEPSGTVVLGEKPGRKDEITLQSQAGALLDRYALRVGSVHPGQGQDIFQGKGKEAAGRRIRSVSSA